MITQVLLENLAGLVSLLVGLIPPLPPVFGEALASVLGGATALAPSVAALGALVPFDAVGTVLAFVPSVMAFWVALLGIRVSLWAFGR